jgi:hypothetical protein
MKDDTSAFSMKIEIPAADPGLAYKIGFIVLRAIQQTLTGNRSGRWYPLPGNIHYEKTTPKEYRADNYIAKFFGENSRDKIMGAAYQASAPFEAPASRTGRLRQSFFMKVVPDMRTGFKAVISTVVYYADDLQYGTEKIWPRPFVTIAMRKCDKDIRRVLRNYTFQLLRRFTYSA